MPRLQIESYSPSFDWTIPLCLLNLFLLFYNLHLILEVAKSCGLQR